VFLWWFCSWQWVVKIKEKWFLQSDKVAFPVDWYSKCVITASHSGEYEVHSLCGCDAVKFLDEPVNSIFTAEESLLCPENAGNRFIFETILNHYIYMYRVSQEERTKLRESVSYVKLYRYNPKHLYLKLNGYGDNGQRKVWTSCISAYCTSTAV